MCSFEQHRDGVVSTFQVHGGRNGGAPSTIGHGGGGEQRVAVQLDQQFKSDQALSVNRIKIIQSAVKHPCISTGRINSVLEQERHPRTMREEEGSITFASSIITLRCNLSDQSLVSEVKDVRNQPIKGEVAVRIGDQGADENAFNDELHIMVGYTDQLIVDNGAGD